MRLFLRDRNRKASPVVGAVAGPASLFVGPSAPIAVPGTCDVGYPPSAITVESLMGTAGIEQISPGLVNLPDENEEPVKLPAPCELTGRVNAAMRILMVEDERRLAGLIQQGLQKEGHAVDVTGTGEDAVDWVRVAPYDAIVLDVILPGIDGLEVCRRLRRSGVAAPILLLTARDAVIDRVAGLDAGADDYLVKPFAFDELFARLRALQRRPPEQVSAVLEAGSLRLDPAAHRVWRADREVTLTDKEFRVLECLLRRPGQALTRTIIADYVWDYDFANVTNVIDVHIRALRRKLNDPSPGRLIQAIRGVGYRLDSDG